MIFLTAELKGKDDEKCLECVTGTCQVQKTRAGDTIESWEMILENGAAVTVKVKKKQISNVALSLGMFPSI